jgi:8-oxo-dGTP pyrophosphatase MutT (NUDIX family)
METRMPAPAYPAAHVFPVSVKGVAVQGGRVLLLQNERNEWELPGGKLELREDPADCVVREIREEAGWEVTAGPLLDCWQYHIREGADVVIVTYGCHVLSTDPPLVSNEHQQAGLFAMSEIPDLVMPDGYKRSIAAWSARLGGEDAMSGPEAHVPASGGAPLERSRKMYSARRGRSHPMKM